LSHCQWERHWTTRRGKASTMDRVGRIAPNRADGPTRRFGDSTNRRFDDSTNRRFDDSAIRRFGNSEGSEGFDLTGPGQAAHGRGPRSGQGLTPALHARRLNASWHRPSLDHISAQTVTRSYLGTDRRSIISWHRPSLDHILAQTVTRSYLGTDRHSIISWHRPSLDHILAQTVTRSTQQ
jgi:hypothetical protein